MTLEEIERIENIAIGYAEMKKVRLSSDIVTYTTRLCVNFLKTLDTKTLHDLCFSQDVGMDLEMKNVIEEMQRGLDEIEITQLKIIHGLT